MAVETTVTTSSSGLNKIWRKVQGKLAPALNFFSDEYGMFDDLSSYDIDVSAREITVPVDINEGYGIASIAEGDYEAVISSPNVDELTLAYLEFSGRFSASTQAKILDERHRAAALVKQITYQGRKKLEALAREWSDQFYGFGTGYVCETSTVATATNQVLTIDDGYGIAGIDNAAFLASKFKVGERVALIRGGVLVTNGIGTITAVTPATPSISVTFQGSVTTVAADFIVKANSMGDSTIAHTNYNKGLTGLLDMHTSASLHSLTHANWVAAGSNATGGRLSGVRLMAARDEIANKGGGKGNLVILSQGVKRDLFALQSAALRFNDPYAMELDGSVKAKGVTFQATKRVPGGYAFVQDKSSVKKLNIMPKIASGEMSWGEAIRMQDKAGYVFPINFMTQLVCLNRQNLYTFSGLTES